MRIPAAIVACVLLTVSYLCSAQTQQASTPSASSSVMAAGGKVTPAKLTHFEPPVYPRKARAGGIEATVSLSAVVTTDGNVDKVQVISGPQAFVAAAIACVKKWKYIPAKLNGRPVEIQTTIAVRFRLKP